MNVLSDVEELQETFSEEGGVMVDCWDSAF